MSKSLTIQNKLENLEKQKQELIKQRKEEIVSLIEKTNALGIDNILLTGCLLFLSDDKNKEHPIIQEFIKLGKSKTRTPRPKQQLTESEKSSI